MRQRCDACLGPCAHGREHVNQINVYTARLSPEKGPRSLLGLLATIAMPAMRREDEDDSVLVAPSTDATAE